MENYISIKEASLLIGITTTTLRRWEKENKFIANHRTFGGHRRYKLSEVLKLINNDVVKEKRKQFVMQE
jgi:excisionase family DNA binding protein